jgi:hypothetical protein
MDISAITGTDSGFDYYWLPRLSADHKLESLCSSLKQRFRASVNEPEAHEQWLVRTYCAVKYLFAATAMLSAAKYSREKGVRIVQPYLQYYALFNTSRALILLIPEQTWRGGNLLDDVTHSKAPNVVEGMLRCISLDFAADFRLAYDRSLALREYFPYKFPAEELNGELAGKCCTIEDTIRLCSGVAEVAQMVSECLETAFVGRSVPIQLVEDPLRRFFEYSVRSRSFVTDDEDYYRLGRIVKKSEKPCSLIGMVTEGMVEDYFGSWTDPSATGPGAYDLAIEDWTLIFPFP